VKAPLPYYPAYRSTFDKCQHPEASLNKVTPSLEVNLEKNQSSAAWFAQQTSTFGIPATKLMSTNHIPWERIGHACARVH